MKLMIFFNEANSKSLKHSHVMPSVNNLEKSKQFHNAPLGTLRIKPGLSNHNGLVQRYF